jgi:hypothetical protein
MLHGSAAQKMQVDVKDSLPGVCIGVDDETVTAFGNTFLRCNLLCGHEKMTY